MHYDWAYIITFAFLTLAWLVSLFRLLRTGRREYYLARVRGKEYQISKGSLARQSVIAALLWPWSAYKAFAVQENAVLEDLLFLMFVVGLAASILSSLLIKDTWKPRSTQ